MNTESIIGQFEIVEASIHRARLPFETGMLQDEIKETVLWELIRSREQITNMIREIAPERFAEKIKKEVSTVKYFPDISIDKLRTCPYCGDANCQSDHK